jgi:rhamnose utilization protein RhaD (predicted bifunctional aldolase and dehydrogenase)
LDLGLWTLEEAGRYLEIDIEVINKAQEEKKKREEEAMKSGELNQNLNNNKDVMPEPDNKLKRKVKQDTQNKNQQNAGGKKINP